LRRASSAVDAILPVLTECELTARTAVITVIVGGVMAVFATVPYLARRPRGRSGRERRGWEIRGIGARGWGRHSHTAVVAVCSDLAEGKLGTSSTIIAIVIAGVMTSFPAHAGVSWRRWWWFLTHAAVVAVRPRAAHGEFCSCAAVIAVPVAGIIARVCA